VVAEFERHPPNDFRNPGAYFSGTDKPVVYREERLIAADRNELAASVGAGEFHGGGCDVGAVLCELDHVRTVDEVQHLFGEIDFDFCRTAEVDTKLHLSVGSFDYGIIGVAERDGTKTHAVLNILIAVEIPDVTAFAARNESRCKVRILIVA